MNIRKTFLIILIFSLFQFFSSISFSVEPDEILKNADSSKAIPPLYGALIKNEQDVQLLERLAFMARREAANNPQ